MADYSLVFGNLLTGARLGELPIDQGGFGWSEELNGAGTIQGSMPLRPNRPGEVQRITDENFAPGRTYIMVLRDGVVLAGFILWLVSGDVANNSLQFSGAGWHSYLTHRRLTVDLTYSGQDQTSGIAKGVVDTILAGSGLADRVDTSTMVASGVTRDRTYYGYERRQVSTILEQLVAVDDGFDFRWESSFDGSGLAAASLITSYPATGRSTNFVFELGGNVELLAHDVSALGLATDVHGIGEGEADDMVLVTVQDPALRAAYPQFDDVVVHKDVSNVATLRAHARRALVRGSAELLIPKLRAYPDTDPQIGTFVVGDLVRVRGTFGLLDVDGTYRLTRIEVGVDQNGTEQIDLTLAPQAVFQ